jgi:GNAT superfamily N-acetyltransferase
VERFKDIYNSAWDKNWGFVPMTDAEMNKLAKDLKQFIDPDLCIFAEYQGEPIAACLTVPDYNQPLKKLNGRLTAFGLPLGYLKLLWNARKIDRVRLMALGVKSGWRRRGIDAVLIEETIRRTRELGYAGGEISWTLEDNNLINSAIEACGCTRTKLYRMYEGATG